MVASLVRPPPQSRSPPTPPRAELGSQADPAIVEGERDAIRHVRVFVSSPGDTIHERGRVDRVVERLNGEFAGSARLETIRWETEFYRADTGFQPQIPEAAECDIVIAIFRHRIGTELPSTFARLPDGSPYPSGTAYEVLSAIEACRRQGRPEVFVFRDSELPMVRLDDPEAAETRAQWERLKAFWETWFVDADGRYKAAFQNFASVDDFEAKLEGLLRGWVENKILRPRPVLWPIEVMGSPYRGLAAFGAKHARVFFGRSRDITRAVDDVEGRGGARHAIPPCGRREWGRQVVLGPRRPRAADYCARRRPDSRSVAGSGLASERSLGRSGHELSGAALRCRRRHS